MNKTLTYTPQGDYLLPDLSLNEPPRALTAPLGRYARMRKAFLKTHRPIIYTRLLLTEQLFPHLREVEEAATMRMAQTMSVLTVRAALPDKLSDPMTWTAEMNTLRVQAEELVLNELIYQE